MKIIDLVEKQRNNEMLPKHIRYENEDLYFDGIAYFDKEENNDLLDILAIHGSALTHLYDEVEIIEEDKEIEKLENEIEFYSYSKYESYKNEIDRVLYILKGMNLTEEKIKNMNNNINKLIDEVNKLKNN